MRIVKTRRMDGGSEVRDSCMVLMRKAAGEASNPVYMCPLKVPVKGLNLIYILYSTSLSRRSLYRECSILGISRCTARLHSRHAC